MYTGQCDVSLVAASLWGMTINAMLHSKSEFQIHFTGTFIRHDATSNSDCFMRVGGISIYSTV